MTPNRQNGKQIPIFQFNLATLLLSFGFVSVMFFLAFGIDRDHDGTLAEQRKRALDSMEILESSVVRVHYISPSLAVRSPDIGAINPRIPLNNLASENKGSVNLSISVIRFNRYVGVKRALEALDVRGFRPADISELLAFSKANSPWPKSLRELGILALGSTWKENGRDYGLCLHTYDNSLEALCFQDMDHMSSNYCRFLVVKK